MSTTSIPAQDSTHIEFLPSVLTWKRLLDIAWCLAALPLLWVAFMGVALLHICAARGPVFFRQERIGFHGRKFMLYKFRTMRVGAVTTAHQSHFEELVRSHAPMQKLDDRGDDRLIPGGWLLRASGIDELPQLINILCGEMSLVGPRPCIPYEYEQYTVPERERFEALPGLTGLWQVSGKNRTTFEEMVELDIRYVRHKSLLLDLWIVAATLPAVILQIRDHRIQISQTSPLAEAGFRHTCLKANDLKSKNDRVTTLRLFAESRG